ncbi:MAG: hypothetical protein LBF34_00605 [Puniceicoccales bacterium]|jgi:hypothetical protein|nr:hypothetical protein [Puniceicoccales bacterium]
MSLSSYIGKIFFVVGMLFLAGCDGENICNMTPSVMLQNQSNIYTLTMAIRGMDGDVSQKSIKPYIVVNGKKHEMKKHPDGNNVFVYDCYFYGVGTILYYFEVVYGMSRNGSIREKVAKSKLFSATVTDKYIFALDANRGPVGVTVNVVGYGLTRADRVRFGKRVVPTNWLSAGAIEFVVPSVECDNEYEVYVLANRKELFAGTFFVDASTLRCSTDFIRLANGESQRIVFMLDHPAPEEGVEIEITTDIPDSIVMPEVHFMPGERTVSVNITGGEESAKGMLFVRAKGFSSLEIPLEVGDEADAVAVSKKFYPDRYVWDDDDVVVL